VSSVVWGDGEGEVGCGPGERSLVEQNELAMSASMLAALPKPIAVDPASGS